METFDLQLTGVLGVLLSVPQEGRDPTWCKNFQASAARASLASFEPQIETGPDSFPYFQLAMPDAGAFTPFSIVHILNDCIENGVGAVIHTTTQRDEQPAWVFTLGDLVAYSLFQDFEGDPKVYQNPEVPPGDDVDRTLLRAVPSEEYLPTGARAAIGRFMRGPFQHPDPRIGLVSGCLVASSPEPDGESSRERLRRRSGQAEFGNELSNVVHSENIQYDGAAG